MYLTENTLFYKTLTLYMIIKVSGLIRKYENFSVLISMDIDMKTLIYLFLPFSYISIGKHRSWLGSSGDPYFYGRNLQITTCCMIYKRLEQF